MNEGSLSAYCSENMYADAVGPYYLTCAQWPKLFSGVQLNTRDNGGVVLSEILVFTLGMFLIV